jgi:hypothetical protein
MVEITIHCVCGEAFNYTIPDPNRLKSEWDSTGVVPLIVPHKDHFVTIYLDKELKIRSIERVILVDNNSASSVIETTPEKDIKTIISDLSKKYNLLKQFDKFSSALFFQVNEPENLFVAGRIVGSFLWKHKRDEFIKMGAKYQPDVDLIVKSELRPILERTGNLKLEAENQLTISECIGPSFAIGIAQGVLNAISEVLEHKMNVKIEYKTQGDVVNLTLAET